MLSHGLNRDPELVSDLRVREALHKQHHHAELPLGQRFEGGIYPALPDEETDNRRVPPASPSGLQRGRIDARFCLKPEVWLEAAAVEQSLEAFQKPVGGGDPE